MFLTALTLATGLVLLGAGGNYLVAGAEALARRAGVSQLFIGLTFVGLGTSAPELATSLTAVERGSDAIALGNIVGSNSANILFVVATTALFFGALTVTRRQLLRDGGFGVLAATLLVVALNTTGLMAAWGVAFLGLVTGYLLVCFHQERSIVQAKTTLEEPEEEREHKRASRGAIAISILIALGGLAGVLVGARVTVDASIDIARGLGVNETIVGLTVVAIGTSLPEMAASFVAAARGMSAMALGNILGSNIFNILLIGGVVAFASTGTTPHEIAVVDAPVALGAAILILVIALPKSRIGAQAGGVLLAGYAGYLLTLVAR